MTEEECSYANKGEMKFLVNSSRTIGEAGFLSSQDSEGSNFLHLLMNIKAEHEFLSSSNDCSNFLHFIEYTLYRFPKLVFQSDQRGNTPLHILAQNKDLCKTMADVTFQELSILSKLLLIYNDAWVPAWVKENAADGDTPLHKAIKAHNKVLVLPLLSYSEESACLVNKHRETPLHLLAKTNSDTTEEFMVEEMMKLIKANRKALELQDNDGLTPMTGALKAENLNLVIALLCSDQEFSDTKGQTQGQVFLKNPLNYFLDKLLQIEAFRKILEQKYKGGNTLLHIAIQEKCFGFVQELLEKCGSEHYETSEDNQWLTDLLRIPNNVGETPEDYLADLSTLSRGLEEKLLSDRRMRGIRSSWRIPRTQLQNYMNSMNIIAALQTTITFTAAFTVPGGLIQDLGTPLLIWRIAFQVFMISDVVAMCLSMLVLICLLWMVATNKRESVMLQDFALWLLLASFVATLLAFMTGVYATVYYVKPWIAITTLVLCCLLMLLIHRFMLIKLLLFLKYRKVPFVKKLRSILRPAC